MTHWAELTLTSTVAFFSGALSLWYMQRGMCRSCRVRYGFRRLLQPFASRAVQRMPAHLQAIAPAMLNVLAICLAFAPMDSARIAWYIFKMRGKNG